ncbi:hypothetical protein F4805DRAFT_471944 [Annulohypoxylon moriforme]|nr:hypothetical protein F4805DRAFT_471944 [Annulohypoxylon moriforme]
MPDPDALEAIRIYGDSRKDGFGSFPMAIERDMIATGLVWMMVHPQDRIVPDVWAAFVDYHEDKSDEEDDEEMDDFAKFESEDEGSVVAEGSMPPKGTSAEEEESEDPILRYLPRHSENSPEALELSIIAPGLLVF